MYIPEAAVDATLRTVTRKGASGSRIVFDYFLRSALGSSTSALREVSKLVANVGEPFVFGVAGEDARAFVTARGLRVLSDFGSAELGSAICPQVWGCLPRPLIGSALLSSRRYVPRSQGIEPVAMLRVCIGPFASSLKGTCQEP